MSNKSYNDVHIRASKRLAPSVECAEGFLRCQCMYDANLTQAVEVTVAVCLLRLIIELAVHIADCHGT